MDHDPGCAVRRDEWPWLFYGKAGGGWVGNDDFTINNLTTGTSITASNNTNSGWLVGAGIEWAFAPNWSVKIEYDYLAGCGKTEQGSRSDSDPFTWGFGYVHGQNEFFRSLLVLLCHKFGCLLRAAQRGQRESVVARAATNLRRIVAIEFGTWRSGRNGGSSGLVTFA